MSFPSFVVIHNISVFKHLRKKRLSKCLTWRTCSLNAKTAFLYDIPRFVSMFLLYHKSDEIFCLIPVFPLFNHLVTKKNLKAKHPDVLTSARNVYVAMLRQTQAPIFTQWHFMFIVFFIRWHPTYIPKSAKKSWKKNWLTYKNTMDHNAFVSVLRPITLTTLSILILLWP